jgi:predicted Zn-dependent protease
MGACAFNPLIGREQLILVPDSEMAMLGAQSWTDHRASASLTRDEALRSRVERVAQRVLQSNGKDWRSWDIAVFEDDSLNAFALPGGKIGINSALVRFCRTDDELAAVIGHEIAHVDLRHAAERFSQDMAARGIIGIAVPDNETLARVFGMGASLGVLLPYSRKHELEADRVGMSNMAAAGYDPMAAVDLWVRMSSQSGRPSMPAFLSTHPADDKRIEAIRLEAERLKAAGL